jgi:hypothetical protein
VEEDWAKYLVKLGQKKDYIWDNRQRRRLIKIRSSCPTAKSFIGERRASIYQKKKERRASKVDQYRVDQHAVHVCRRQNDARDNKLIDQIDRSRSLLSCARAFACAHGACGQVSRPISFFFFCLFCFLISSLSRWATKLVYYQNFLWTTF